MIVRASWDGAYVLSLSSSGSSDIEYQVSTHILSPGCWPGVDVRSCGEVENVDRLVPRQCPE